MNFVLLYVCVVCFLFSRLSGVLVCISWSCLVSVIFYFVVVLFLSFFVSFFVSLLLYWLLFLSFLSLLISFLSLLLSLSFCISFLFVGTMLT